MPEQYQFHIRVNGNKRNKVRKSTVSSDLSSFLDLLGIIAIVLAKPKVFRKINGSSIWIGIIIDFHSQWIS